MHDHPFVNGDPPKSRAGKALSVFGTAEDSVRFEIDYEYDDGIARVVDGWHEDGVYIIPTLGHSPVTCSYVPGIMSEDRINYTNDSAKYRLLTRKFSSVQDRSRIDSSNTL